MRGLPTRHGFVVAARRRTSACAQGDGAAWRGRDTSGGTRDVERLRARRGRGTRPAASAFGVDGVTGKKQIRRWSEGKLINNSKFQKCIL